MADSQLNDNVCIHSPVSRGKLYITNLIIADTKVLQVVM